MQYSFEWVAKNWRLNALELKTTMEDFNRVAMDAYKTQNLQLHETTGELVKVQKHIDIVQ